MTPKASLPIVAQKNLAKFGTALRRHVAALSIVVMLGTSSARSETATVSGAGVYSGIVEIAGGTKHRFLAQHSGGRVDVFECKRTACRIETSFDAPSKVWASAEGPSETFVAFGYGKEKLAAPVSLVSFDEKFKQTRPLFDQPSERAQVTFLRFDSARLWLSFFKTKYETSAGYFEQSSSGPWTYREVSSGRLEDSVDVYGDSLLVGRPYGDGEGQDGDAKIKHRSPEPLLLPSYRGVRAVRFFDLAGRRHPRLLIADGWHQNYGRLAQARITLLEWNESLQRYGAYLIRRDPGQYGYSRILVPGVATNHFFALGNKQLELFSGPAFGQPSVVYTAASADAVFEAALVSSTEKESILAVYNGTIEVVAVSH